MLLWLASLVGKKQFQLQKKYSQIGNLANKAITLTSRMYANWQGNFIEVSQYFISPQQTEKLILNENATRKVGYFGKEQQSNRVYRIYDKSITLSSQGNQTRFYLFKCRTPNKENVRGNGGALARVISFIR
ncbi:hypothetical protein [Gilliamella sp. Choc6-1]|uniref:hypothetical protein n=1 Tax=Gilliamella sp. Choc6-1 TaxID=3120239 RepID=UPI001146B00F|nr:hypothetical protein [Gilliamella apicola]